MKTKRVYLGRNISDGDYELGEMRRQWHPLHGFDEGFLTSMCSGKFERITGIKLEDGEVRPVRIHFEFLDKKGRQE